MRIAEVAFALPLPRPFHYEVPPSLRPAPGARVRVPFGRRRLVGTVLRVFDGEPERALKPIEAVLDSSPLLTPELLDCAAWLSRRYGAPLGECLKALLPPYVKSGVPASRGSASSPPAADGVSKGGRDRGLPAAEAFQLTSGQEQALAALGARLEERRFHAALLYGVPASGKTEVYLRLIRRAVDAGGQALFLVPEISLTRPFFEEFAAGLEAPVVLWHSRLGVRERRAAWLGLREGRVKVVVGARSAALLPFQDLRLAVLDEEQDESFKQEGASPLYHAREVCLHRARESGSLVVLGSATPSLEAWSLARQGAAQLLEMPERVSSVARPDVGVLPFPPRGRCLSDQLLGKLKERLQRREQAILLVNRRGFATLVLCAKCGWVDRCPTCGVAKIQHEGEGGAFVLRCHHCSRSGPMPPSCPKCGQPSLRVTGTGTQRVVSELKKALPGVRVLRMDRDTVSREGREEKGLYERFLAGEADVLVGTKLVAKSFHFPEVTLVGVVDADTMLHMPDFRASERTMQLLAQVAGRSGRAEKKGEVLLQTLNPEHGAIAGAVRGDYAAFAEGELRARRELGYPPFSTLVRLVWGGKNALAVEEAAKAACDRLRSELSPAGHEVVGPAPAVVRQSTGLFRFHALLKVPDAGQLDRALAAARAAPPPSSVRLKVNVDPYDLF